ncbi:hypothetical protein ACWEQ1_22085 [Streptomyces nodosus]
MAALVSLLAADASEVLLTLGGALYGRWGPPRVGRAVAVVE